MTLLAAAAIGLVVGFLGGLLGKGGSAIATPLLHAVGVRAIVAVAAPLPATIPSTLLASYAYSKERLVDWRVVRWTVAFGIPATVAGAVLTRWVSGGSLVVATEVVLILLGIRLIVGAWERRDPSEVRTLPRAWKLATVAILVGVVSGLLANSGGFLLAPLFVAVLHLPIKSALASSLAVATVLAVPGTVVHAALGHMDWTLVAVFAVTSVPLAFVGARTALRIDPVRLERIYGVVLVVLGAVFLVLR
jgi:uncharacterized membrane protein YfcA